MKTIVILFNRVSQDSSRDELDVLVQVDAVEGALRELGFQPDRLPFSLDLAESERQLRAIGPVAVFNLTESVESDGSLIHLAPSLLDHLRIPYSGGSTGAVFFTNHKVLCKKWLRIFGIRTPDWVDLEDEETYLLRRIDSRFIIKSVCEHASSWFNEDSVVTPADVDDLLRMVRDVSAKNKGAFFAERFVQGREFNVALLAGRVLAVPEIVFVNYPEDKLRVVDYRAKWDKSSFEYQHTERNFTFPPQDGLLLALLEYMALECWKKFNLRGYARVDFRVDPRGIPWVIEVNANPCISPDAGFFAAAAHTGLTYTEMIRQILADSGISS